MPADFYADPEHCPHENRQAVACNETTDRWLMPALFVVCLDCGTSHPTR